MSHLQDPSNPEHQMVLTGKSKNGDILRVRCKCMAEYRSVSSRYYNYDILAEVTSTADAVIAYKKHLRESRERNTTLVEPVIGDRVIIWIVRKARLVVVRK